MTYATAIDYAPPSSKLLRKEVYYLTCHMNFNDYEYVQTTLLPKVVLRRPDYVQSINRQEIHFDSFDAFYNEIAFEHGSYGNFYVDCCFFSKKPKIVLDTMFEKIKITEKNFKSIKFKFVYKPFTGNINELERELSADDFIEYLKERNMYIMR